eukprot:6197917-Pleurochrysis_carterae.AAC.1
MKPGLRAIVSQWTSIWALDGHWVLPSFPAMARVSIVTRLRPKIAGVHSFATRARVRATAVPYDVSVLNLCASDVLAVALMR